MTRTTLPYCIPDLSALARALARDLTADAAPPGHLSLMNMLARAAGFRNFQHFRASAVAADRLTNTQPAPDMAKVAQALRHFDPQGRMKSWPSRTHLQHLCLWGLWPRLPSDTSMTERQISDRLNDWHLFGDAAILRRTLWELKLVHRTPDSRDYRRIEQPPTPEARALIAALHQRPPA